MTGDSNSRSSLLRPAVYRIRVSGRMDPEWSERLGGMTVSVLAGKPQGMITELTGRIPDQAALMGILDQLYNCGIPLLSVECLGEKPGGE